MFEKQMCTRNIKLSDFNISRAKYNELKYFCVQYAEKKQKLQMDLYLVLQYTMPQHQVQ